MEVAALLFVAAFVVPPVAVGAGIVLVLLARAGRQRQAAPIGQPVVHH